MYITYRSRPHCSVIYVKCIYVHISTALCWWKATSEKYKPAKRVPRVLSALTARRSMLRYPLKSTAYIGTGIFLFFFFSAVVSDVYISYVIYSFPRIVTTWINDDHPSSECNTDCSFILMAGRCLVLTMTRIAHIVFIYANFFF